MKKLLMIFIIFSMLLSLVPLTALAEEESVDAEELAAELEFMFEEGVIKDPLGNPVGINVKKLEDRYGEVPPELQALEQEIANKNFNQSAITPMINPSMGKADAIRACMYNNIKSTWSVTLSGSAIGTFYGYVDGKNFYKAAKLMLKYGARGTAFGIAGSLTAEYFSCALNA